LFLLLNILVAVLFRPPATLASIASGFTGAWVVTLVKGRVPPGMTRTAFVYLVLSGIFLLLNYRWHRARDRAESQRVAHAEQRERLLEEAQEAKRAKDRLLANVSHELRTPLNAIAGWSVMMIRPDVKAEDVRRAAEVIKRNAEALARTVDQLLDASLADAGRIGLRSAPVSVGRAVSAAVESMLPEAAARGVTVRNAVAPDAGTIQADQERLHQVLLTVLSKSSQVLGFARTGHSWRHDRGRLHHHRSHR
jgi:signal transduction histidine kinase